MKIIFLNTWEAEMADALTAFLNDQSRDTDIFCFQEATEKMLQIAGATLRDYHAITASKRVTDDNIFFQATYLKNNIPLLASEVMLQDEPETGVGIATTTSFHNGTLRLCNFHGTWKPIDKLDDPVRLRQSEKIIEFFKDTPGLKIIGGDFNLFPDTKSMRMFSEHGYRDLIKEFNVTTTRNHLAWDRYPDNKQPYADYIFVSPELTIKNFSVVDSEVSDHLPLILEIE